MPRQGTVGRRQHAALRQFRHFLLVIGELVTTRNVAGRARQRIGKDAAGLRVRGRRERNRRGGQQGRETGQGNGLKHFSGFKFRGSKRRIGLATLRAVAGARVNTPNTAGKGRLSAQPLLWSAHARDEIVVPERGSLLG